MPGVAERVSADDGRVVDALGHAAVAGEEARGAGVRGDDLVGAFDEGAGGQGGLTAAVERDRRPRAVDAVGELHGARGDRGLPAEVTVAVNVTQAPVADGDPELVTTVVVAAAVLVVMVRLQPPAIAPCRPWRRRRRRATTCRWGRCR